MWKRGGHLYDVGEFVEIANINGDIHENVNYRMSEYSGRIAQITKRVASGYKINIDHETWTWEDFMFKLPSEDKLFKSFIQRKISESYYKELLMNKKNNIGPLKEDEKTFIDMLEEVEY